MAFRVGRTSEDLKRELTDIIRYVKDPRVSSILTIIKVELSNDLSHCKVYISSLEGMEKAKEAAKGLNNANGFIKHEVNSRIKMRRIPDFHFIADDSTEYSAGIAKNPQQPGHPPRRRGRYGRRINLQGKRRVSPCQR